MGEFVHTNASSYEIGLMSRIKPLEIMCWAMIFSRNFLFVELWYTTIGLSYIISFDMKGKGAFGCRFLKGIV